MAPFAGEGSTKLVPSLLKALPALKASKVPESPIILDEVNLRLVRKSYEDDGDAQNANLSRRVSAMIYVTQRLFSLLKQDKLLRSSKCPSIHSMDPLPGPFPPHRNQEISSQRL